MSKAVMLSIRPKWVEKIANGEKTIEVRKTKPKLDTPFKCYIYCTLKANVPAAAAQGIKERIAMDIERYGDVKVVSIVSDRGREEQMKMEGAKL